PSPSRRPATERLAHVSRTHPAGPGPGTRLRWTGRARGGGACARRSCNRSPMEVGEVAARASGENFPVASLLFPREVRPHLRAVYGFARLVDILGDEHEGDRLAALDQLEGELDACYDGEPTWPVMRVLQPTIRACRLPRDP